MWVTFVEFVKRRHEFSCWYLKPCCCCNFKDRHRCLYAKSPLLLHILAYLTSWDIWRPYTGFRGMLVSQIRKVHNLEVEIFSFVVNAASCGPISSPMFNVCGSINVRCLRRCSSSIFSVLVSMGKFCCRRERPLPAGKSCCCWHTKDRRCIGTSSYWTEVPW